MLGEKENVIEEILSKLNESGHNTKSESTKLLQQSDELIDTTENKLVIFKEINENDKN